MTGWFGGNSPLDEPIARATSSSLEDIAANLEISDLIRSKTVSARDAMRSLRKRLQNSNPNVQLATLKLTDTCVKNGGNHFLAEIASREFIDYLTSLIRAGGGAITNQDVKDKILGLIQAWATAAGYKPEALYIGETYRSLQREGFHFPPKEELATAVFESSAPPDWINSDVCMRCRSEFSFTNRKHHCRNCGRIFDQRCSSKSLVLPHLGITTPVRVDDGCYEMLTQRTGSAPLSPIHAPSSDRSYPGQASRHRVPGSMQPRDPRVIDTFDDDLKRALEMSLEEGKSYSAGHVPNEPASIPKRTSSHRHSSVSSKNRAQRAPSTSPPLDEADEDLAAAIAASLKDMEQQKARHAASMKQQKDKAVESDSQFVLPSNKYELSPLEGENINLFSNLVDRLQSQPRGAILREPRIQELYETVGALRPKLARSYGETMSKHETLLELHSKLNTVVRYYDKMLEDRLTRTYANHNLNYGMTGQLQQYTGIPLSYAPSQSSYTPIASEVENYYSNSYGNSEPISGYGQPPMASYMSHGGGYPPSQAQHGMDRPQGYMQHQPGPPQHAADGQQYPSLPMHRADAPHTDPVSPPQTYTSPGPVYTSQIPDTQPAISQPSSYGETSYQQQAAADSFYRPEATYQPPQNIIQHPDQPIESSPQHQSQQPQQANTSTQSLSRYSTQPQSTPHSTLQQQQQQQQHERQPQPQQQQERQEQHQQQQHEDRRQPPSAQVITAPQQRYQSFEQQYYRQSGSYPPQSAQSQALTKNPYPASAFPSVPQHQLPQQEYRPPVKEEALIEL